MLRVRGHSSIYREGLYRRYYARFLLRFPRRSRELLFFVLPLVLLSLLPRSAGAAIGFVAASSGNNAGGATTLSIAMPTGVTTGHVMVAVVSVRGGTGTTISTVPSGCDFTPKSEPISEKIPKAQPRRLRGQARARPIRKTLCLFFYFPPPNFFFETEKGVFWWFDYCKQ